VADFDEFSSLLLEEAKRFLERANESTDQIAQTAYLHAALLLAFSSLEAHVNAISEEMALAPELTPQELGILREEDVRLENGEFILSGSRIYRLEDRILFLHRRFSGKPLDKQAIWWGRYRDATHLRNKLTHPKDAQVITLKNVELAIEAIIALLNNLYQAIYGKSLPAAGLGLQATLTF
jgi:hypothetical protein